MNRTKKPAGWDTINIGIYPTLKPEICNFES